MRWWSAVVFLVLCAPVFALTDTAPKSHNATSVTAAISASVLGAGDTALALRDMAVMTLRAVGVDAVAAPAPPECAQPDHPDCMNALLWKLSKGTIVVAIVSVPSENTRSASSLRDYGIVELNAVSPDTRRACVATGAPARSLLDLVDYNVASAYHVQEEDIPRVHDLGGTKSVKFDSSNYTFTPPWCLNASCATILTSNDAEGRVLTDVITTHHLQASVKSLDSQLPEIAAKLANRPIIVCDWAPEIYLPELHGTILGPPPCLPSTFCPFETRRTVKYINMLKLSQSLNVINALANLKLTDKDIRGLRKNTIEKGHEAAALETFEMRPQRDKKYGEVRVGFLRPAPTSLEAYDARALKAAAALAEEDIEKERPSNATKFKVQTYDDGCHTANAYKYLTDELIGSEYGSLSAIAGPACGAPWTEVAHQAPTHHMPLLAYTLQAPIASTTRNLANTAEPDLHLQLLAAGDALQSATALAALATHLGWRRLAVLSETSTRDLVTVARKYIELPVAVELTDDGRGVDFDLITKWAARVAVANAHVIYLCVEDARVARAALCGARAAGLQPRAGAVWLLCRVPHRDWLQPQQGENCTRQQLEEVANGYLTVTPEWQLTWEKAENVSSTRRDWEERWRIQCRHSINAAKACDTAVPDANAALLYDILRLWAGALDRLLSQHPAAVDHLHEISHVSTLIEDATTTEYEGLTGRFEWEATGAAFKRRGDLVVTQWDTKSGMRSVGRWTEDKLNLDVKTLHWHTADGRVPDDGSDYCGLQGLAEALHTDCRTAYVALGCLLAAVLVVMLAGAAYHCKRRAEREYRERLAALGMRPLAIKPAGLDRWEVPRERVVINRKLGTGAFGTVYGGHALLAEDRGWSAVAVKTLKAGANTEEKLDFLSEAEAMKRFDHKNVVRLLGVVTKTEPVCTVMEFMLYGDLKNYLLARRHLATGGGTDDEACGEADEASPRRLTSMALDVARALSYLAQLRYVHRDVAARNCLVSARRTVKLADFGMTRLVFENDYYRFSRKGMLPVRWMAPESLALGVFSPASDVWSFGVLLYEIVTFGSLPFQGFSNSEVLGRVKAGHTLELPSGLRPQLEGLIKSCWQNESKSRPTASEVAAFLADSPRLLSPCLDVPLDALTLDADPPWRLPRDQAEARWVSWAAPASSATDTTYLSTDGAIPLDTDSFLP